MGHVDLLQAVAPKAQLYPMVLGWRVEEGEGKKKAALAVGGVVLVVSAIIGARIT